MGINKKKKNLETKTKTTDIIIYTSESISRGLFTLKPTLNRVHALYPNFPPKTECDCLHGGVIEKGRTRNPLTLCSVPVHVWVHIPGDPQCSAEERYNNNKYPKFSANQRAVIKKNVK